MIVLLGSKRGQMIVLLSSKHRAFEFKKGLWITGESRPALPVLFLEVGKPHVYLTTRLSLT